MDDVAKEMCMSRSVLFKKVKEITEMTPNNYIKAIRLQKAAELLIQEEYKINEICYLVGFNNHSYFTKCFVDYFGLLPKEYIAKNIKTIGSVEIPAIDARVIVELPAGTELELKDGKIIANKQNIISYN